jgi:integrase
VRELRNYLHSFAAGRQQLSIDKITVADIEGWFDGRGEAPATRCSNLGRLGALFDLAWRRRYLPENPCLRVTQPRLEQKPPRILSPKEAKALLVTCRKQTPDLLAWLTLGVFAGIRPDELRRLAWADVDAQQGLVTVAAAASKVRRRRIVTLHETARSWLSICKPGRPDQPITPSPIREKRQRARLVGASGVKWSHDLLRHSAASFLLAHHQDAGKVANMLGNSVRILESTYKNLVTPSDCAAFWKLTPAICKNKGP